MQKSWKDLVEDYIFKPLEMHQSSCYVSAYCKSELVHTVDQHAADNSYFEKFDNTLHPAGGIVSTIDDLLKFLSVFVNDGQFNNETYLSKESLDMMLSMQRKQDRMAGGVHRIGYGIGWDIWRFNNENIYTRDGGFQGLATSMSILPEHNLGVISINNDVDLHFAFGMAETTINTYLK